MADIGGAQMLKRLLGFYNVAVGRINGMAALGRFSNKKMYGCFARTRKGAVITRGP